MDTETKKVPSLIMALKNVFGTGIDINEDNEITLIPELKNALDSINTKIVEQPIHTENKSEKKGGGFATKINPKTEKAMRKIHNQLKEKEDREIGE